MAATTTADVPEAPPATPVAVPSNDWRSMLLTALGAPATMTNVAALALWATSEGVDPSNNNWLAITDPGNRWPHAGVVANNGGNPVYAFPSQEVGVQATAAFLAGSYYGQVIQAFRTNAGLGGIFAAINQSPWCRGCQGGHYPLALFNAASTGQIPPGTTDPVPGGPAGGPGTPGAGAVPSNESGCLIGGGDALPGFVPFGQSIPCLFQKSWGWAILGGLALVTGPVVMTAGLLVVVLGPKRAAALAIGAATGNPLVAAAGASSPSATAESSARTTEFQQRRRAAETQARTEAAATTEPVRRRAAAARTIPAGGGGQTEAEAREADQAADLYRLAERRRAARPRGKKQNRGRAGPPTEQQRNRQYDTDPNIRAGLRRRAEAAQRKRSARTAASNEPPF